MAFEIAQFSASAEDGFNSTSTAAVINEIDGRQQVCGVECPSKLGTDSVRWFSTFHSTYSGLWRQIFCNMLGCIGRQEGYVSNIQDPKFTCC